MATDIHADLARAFRSERLLYRSLESPEDEAFLVAVNDNSDAAISSSIGIPRPKTKKDAQDWLQWLNEKSLIGVIICLDPEKEGSDQSTKPNDPKDASPPSTSQPTPIGIIFLKDPYSNSPHHRQGEIGVDIIAAYQGQGYGAEAMRWILGWGFDMAQLHRIRLGCFGWNKKALRVYERIGFRLESTEKEAIWCNGRWWDNYWLAMLEDEWREKWWHVHDRKDTAK